MDRPEGAKTQGTAGIRVTPAAEVGENPPNAGPKEDAAGVPGSEEARDGKADASPSLGAAVEGVHAFGGSTLELTAARTPAGPRGDSQLGRSSAGISFAAEGDRRPTRATAQARKYESLGDSMAPKSEDGEYDAAGVVAHEADAGTPIQQPPTDVGR